jgi:hypothetical protein
MLGGAQEGDRIMLNSKQFEKLTEMNKQKTFTKSDLKFNGTVVAKKKIIHP